MFGTHGAAPGHGRHSGGILAKKGPAPGMLTTLGAIPLKTGVTLAVSLVEPPQPDYAARLCVFLAHKSPSAFRGIRQRLTLG